MGSNEIYREKISGSLDLERETLHISDDSGRIAIVDTKTYDGGTIGSPNNEIRYQIGNHLQSASLELDDTAAIISYEEYHPFGTSAYRLGRTSTEVAQKRYRYAGKENDGETGLYYYGARYYAAWLGKFTSVDPRKDDYPMWSSYLYAGNSPVTMTDVNGEGPGDPEEQQTYKVVSGDTLSEIAAGYEGVSAEDIKAANPELIKDIDHIEVGWILKIPGQESSTTSKPEIKIGEIQLDSGEKALFIDIGDYIEHLGLTDEDEIASGVSEMLSNLQEIQGYSSIVIGGLDATIFSNPNYVTPSGYLKSVKNLATFNLAKGGTGEMGKIFGYEYVNKWPKEGLHGNTTGGKSLKYRAKFGNAVKGVSKGLAWASIATTAIDLGVKVYNDEAEQEDYIKAGLDVTVTAISMTTGPAGWIIGGAYFLMTMEQPTISSSDLPEKQKAINRGEVNPVDALKVDMGPAPKLKSKYPIYNIPTPRPQPTIRQGR